MPGRVYRRFAYYTQTEEKHRAFLTEVLPRMAANGLIANFSKGVLKVPSVTYLGEKEKAVRIPHFPLP
jgi:hypothetical protein